MFLTMIFKSMLQLFEYNPHLPGLKGHSFTVFTREARPDRHDMHYTDCSVALWEAKKIKICGEKMPKLQSLTDR